MAFMFCAQNRGEPIRVNRVGGSLSENDFDSDDFDASLNDGFKRPRNVKLNTKLNFIQPLPRK